MVRRMKTRAAILLTVIMGLTFVLAGCGNDAAAGSANTDPSSENAAAKTMEADTESFASDPADETTQTEAESDTDQTERTETADTDAAQNSLNANADSTGSPTSTQILNIVPGASDATRLELYGPAESMSNPDAALIECETPEDDPNYLTDLMEAEVYNYKYIFERPFAFAANAQFYDYESLGRKVKRIVPEEMTEEDAENIRALYDMRKTMVQTAPAQTNIYPIWEGEPATADLTGTLEWTLESNDNEGFLPFLVAYRVKDQSAVKGNIIVIAGGGYQSRANYSEGYPIAEAFYEMGYNAFVLQRRVEPYSPQDAWLDLARSIRYLRHNADELGIEGLDMMMATGFSGGSSTIIGTMFNLYGDIQPTVYDTDYQPDEVDAENADLDVAFLIYGFRSVDESGESIYSLETDNPNLPMCFLAVGSEDDYDYDEKMNDMAEALRERTEVEYHLFAGINHGYGVGAEGNSSAYWLPMADAFISHAKIVNATHEVDGVIFPGYCTKYQIVVTGEGEEEGETYVGTNDEETQFYMAWDSSGYALEMEGTIDEDGELTVTKETFKGYLAQTAPEKWEATQADAWIMFE